MDFFAHQERARKQTGRLVFLFVAAVALMVASSYIVVTVAVHLVGAVEGEAEGNGGLLRHWNPVMFGWTAGITLLLIAAGTLYKIAALRAGGGEAVADMFGGTFVHPGTVKEDERKLLNVVEEMALAAGVAVPKVFLIDSGTINALAAGYSINGAVIGVTRGCMEKLTRQELQGVVAHEFSHIINGDMASNLKLVGLLHGILLLAIVGRVLVRAAGRGGGRNSGQARFIFFGVGVGLVTIGYFGVFFGRLIKAAVSRQREFLADATAVQYTRDPEGIYGALRKIFSEGGAVNEPAVEELAHLFFTNALGGPAGGVLSSHPRTEERLERIMPGGLSARATQAAETNRRRAEGELPRDKKLAHNDEKIGGHILAGLGMGRIGRAGLDGAAGWLRGLHPLAKESLTTPRGSGGLLTALLMSRVPLSNRAQFEEGLRPLPNDIRKISQELLPVTDAIPQEDFLAVADMCLSTLRELPTHDLRNMRAHLETLAKEDGRGADFFGYMVNSFIRARLDDAISGGQAGATSGALKNLPNIRVVLSFLAAIGHPGDELGAELSYQRAIEVFVRERPTASIAQEFKRICEPEKCTLEQFDQALFALRATPPGVKRATIAAAAAGIFGDNEVKVGERELFRAVAGVLDCPVPPSLGGDGGA